MVALYVQNHRPALGSLLCFLRQANLCVLVPELQASLTKITSSCFGRLAEARLSRKELI